MKIADYGNRPGALRLFEVGVCSWMILHSLKLLGLTQQMFSPIGLCPEYQSPFPLDIDKFIVHFGGQYLLISAIGVQIALCVFTIFKPSSYLTRFGIWFLSVNIFATIP